MYGNGHMITFEGQIIGLDHAQSACRVVRQENRRVTHFLSIRRVIYNALKTLSHFAIFQPQTSKEFHWVCMCKSNTKQCPIEMEAKVMS